MSPLKGSYVPDPGRITFELDPTLDFRAPILRSGHACWDIARGSRPMPARRDIDPVLLPTALLPHILLIEVHRVPAIRFRWRLIGTYITDVVGRDMTGAWWDEIYLPDVIEALQTGPMEVLRTGRPVRTIGRAPLDERAFLVSENMDAPLSSDGSTIDMIMVVTRFEGLD